MAVQADNAAQSTGLTALISTMQRNTDVVLAAGVMMIIAMMVIPLPAPLIDLLVATNIAVAVTVLLIAMYTRDVLAFSVFPALLLLVTLFRLAINVSSTRLILLQADAGDIIASFGNFVVGGSVVVGIVVFLILLVIQFVVITNGAGRVAEVAARFTLDAMPGKQMSIDADLNAGIINEADARERRDRITKEADFYGAMDGASKFVKGDAIAGLVIVAINLVGGIAIGTMQNGLSPGDAVSTYSLAAHGRRRARLADPGAVDLDCDGPRGDARGFRYAPRPGHRRTAVLEPTRALHRRGRARDVRRRSGAPPIPVLRRRGHDGGCGLPGPRTAPHGGG